MSVIFILIGISVTVAATFLGLYLWAVRSGQYDDTYSPAVRILFEENETNNQNNNSNGEV